jgi:hypothetical protein
MSDVRQPSPAAAATAPPQPRLGNNTAAAHDTESEPGADLVLLLPGEGCVDSNGGDEAVDHVLAAWNEHYRKLEGLRHSEDVSEASTEESERAVAARRAASEAQPEEAPGDGAVKSAQLVSLPAQGSLATTPQTISPVPTPLQPADSTANMEEGTGPAISAPARPVLQADSGQAHAQSVLLMGADSSSTSAVPLKPEQPQMGGNPNLAQVELMMDSDASLPKACGSDSPPQQQRPPQPQRPLMDDSAVRAQDSVM